MCSRWLAVFLVAGLNACADSEDSPRREADVADAQPADVERSDAGIGDARPDAQLGDTVDRGELDISPGDALLDVEPDVPSDTGATDVSPDATDVDVSDDPSEGGRFREAFTTTAGIDLERSTGVVDLDRGEARGLGARLDALGQGEPTDLLALEGDAPQLPPGDLHLGPTDAAWNGVATVAGDLVLRVSGPLRLAGSLDVEGRLLIVVSDGIEFLSGTIRARGGVAIHNHGTAPFRIGPGVTLMTKLPDGDGDIDGPPLEILSVGSIEIGDNAWVDTAAPLGEGRAGDLVVRTNGDIEIDDSAGLASGYGPCDFLVAADGDVILVRDALLWGGGMNGDRTGRWEVRVGGDFLAGNGSSIGTDLDHARLVVEGRAVFSGAELLVNSASTDFPPRTATNVTIEADHVAVENDGYLNAGGVAHRVNASALVVRARTDILLLDGAVFGASVDCGPPGDIVLEAGGDITIADDAYIDLGVISRPGEGCETPVQHGWATIRAAGTLDIGTRQSPVNVFSVRRVPLDPGRVLFEAGADLEIGPVDAGLRGTAHVWTVVQDTFTGAIREVRATPGVENLTTSAACVLPAEGEACVPLDEVVGTMLSPGWRVRVDLPWLPVSGASVDAVEIVW